MADTKYLKKRRQGWYFQLAVPREFQKALGKSSIILSLKTRDIAVARKRRWVKLVEAQEAFTKLSGAGPPDIANLLPEKLLEIDDVARATYRATLVQMDTEARRDVSAWGEAELDAAYREACSGYIFDRDFRPVAEPLAAYCAQHGVQPESQLYMTLGMALLSARLRALEGRKLALEGKASAEPATFLDSQPVDHVSLQPMRSRRGGLIFAEVAARFIAERQRDPAFKLSEQSRCQYESTFRLFDQYARQPSLDEVDRSKASAFLDAIAAFDPHWSRHPGVKAMNFADLVERFGKHPTGLATVTINRHAHVLGLVWKHAEARLGFEGKNPWPGQSRPTTKHRGNSETDKRGFTTLEIAKLLERRPVAKPPKHDVATALPWLILIAAFSAMRLNEVCSLAVSGVKEASGILFFDLIKAKTDAGVRIVPVHSQILAAGFREYVALVGSGPLWPALRPLGPDKKPSKYATKAFIKYRRALGLVDIDKITGRDRLDFHSLRRSAVTALKHAGIPEHDVAEVVGHENPRVTYGVYADRQQLARLQAIVEAIRYNNDH